MTWIVWRQQRPMFITLAVGLVVAVAAILLLRAGMVADLNARNLLDCAGKGMSACMGQNSTEFQSTWFDRMHVAHALVIAAPALMGVFVGAPLFAREYEQGTHALAFTQSVSRTRWMVTKFVVAAVPALVAVVVFQIAVRSWVSAADKLGPLATGPFYFSTFDAQSVSPIAYTLFAYTLGMFAGALFKRTLVAMSLTLALFVVVRTVVSGMRELMITPTRLVWDDPTVARSLEPRPLIADQGYLDASGAKIADATSKMNCGSKDGEPIRDTLTCYRENGIAKAYADVIPVDQATTLHLIEASIFAGLAVLFVLGSVWAVRRQV